MKNKTNDDIVLYETINYVKKGFTRGLWRNRRQDAEHIINNLYKFSKKNYDKN